MWLKYKKKGPAVLQYCPLFLKLQINYNLDFFKIFLKVSKRIFLVPPLLQEAGEIMDYWDTSWGLPDLKPTTRQSYTYSQNSFLAFCEKFCLTPLPCTELNLVRYIAYLRDAKRLSGSSIYAHLAAVKHLHLMNGFSTDGFHSLKASKASKFIYL